MARIRTIKPAFWSDQKIARLSRDARLTFIGLWNLSDDYGVAIGSAAYIRSQLFPYDEDVSIQDVQSWLEELTSARFIVPFEANEESFFYIRQFSKHQNINRPSATRNPVPPDAILSPSDEPSGSTHGVLNEYSLLEGEGEGEGKREREGARAKISDHVSMTEDQKETLVVEYGEDAFRKMVEKLENYKASTGKEYKSDFHAIKKWVVHEVLNGNGKGNRGSTKAAEAWNLIEHYIRTHGARKKPQIEDERALGFIAMRGGWSAFVGNMQEGDLPFVKREFFRAHQ